MIFSVSDKEVICVRVHSNSIARSKYYGEITKGMNFNCPVTGTSESIAPNDNNLELNMIAYTFSKIDSNLNFNSSSAIVNSLPPSLWFLFTGDQGN